MRTLFNKIQCESSIKLHCASAGLLPRKSLVTHGHKVKDRHLLEKLRTLDKRAFIYSSKIND